MVIDAALLGNINVRALVIFVVFVLILKAIFYFMRTYLKVLASNTQTKFDDFLLDKISLPITVLIILYGAKVAFDSINLSQEVLILRIFDTIAVLNVAYILIKGLDLFVEHWLKDYMVKTKSADKTMLPMILRTINLIVIVFCGIFMLHIWSIEIGPFLAGLGIAGIAIAFALQNTLGNVIGGISVVIDRNFKVGDTIEINPGLPNAIGGSVTDISFRSTKILSYDNEEIIIPNSVLAGTTFKNTSHPDPTVRVVIDFGISYGSDIAKVKKIAMSAISGAELLAKEPAPLVLFTDMADSSLRFRIMFWITDYTQKGIIKDQVMASLLEGLEKAKIIVPYPTHTVHLKKS